MTKNDAELSLYSHDEIAKIPAMDWDACAGDENPFVSHSFLKALEESGSVGAEVGWIPHHLVIKNEEQRIYGVIPAYLKLHSFGEYVFDQSWAQAFERYGGQYYPKLQMSIPFSPVSGPRIMCRPHQDLSIAEIGGLIEKTISNMGLSSAHITFCTQSEWEELGQNGWLQRLGLQYHWHNRDYKSFDDFLNSLTSRHRKTIKRERRDANAAGLEFKTLRGLDIKGHHWDAFYQFYLSTIDRKWGSAYLNRGFFDEIARTLGDKIILMMAFDNDIPIAAALNLLGRDTLFGRNWGCKGNWPFLHFELCYYRAIDYAIEHGLNRVEAGAQGEHKVLRGYVPQLTYSVHSIKHQEFSNAVRDFLEGERKVIKSELENISTFYPFRKIA